MGTRSSGLLWLSRRIGADPELVQAFGGNTSEKIGDRLIIKGSGRRLRGITRADFTELRLRQLSVFNTQRTMTAAQVDRVLREATVSGPPPSVETPLYCVLPHRFVAHTHDLASMIATNRRDAAAEVRRIWGTRVLMIPFVWSGFPLGRAVRGRGARRGIIIEKHGLVTWGESAEECWANLKWIVSKAPKAPRLPIAASRKRSPKLNGILDRTLGCEGDILKIAVRGWPTPEHAVRAGLKAVIYPNAAETILIPEVGVVVPDRDALDCVRAAFRVMRVLGKRYRPLRLSMVREILRKRRASLDLNDSRR